MAKAKVKVGIYKKRQRVYGYGYDNPDLISEEQFEELVADRKEELVKSEGEFEDYLSDNYSYKEIFDMDEGLESEMIETKEEVKEESAGNTFFLTLGKWLGIGIVVLIGIALIWKKIKKFLPL